MTTTLPVVIVGGGPAGMVAGLLLARADVPTIVIEKHCDFLRDFRGDTVHPSTLELFHELGCLDALLRVPHTRIDQVSVEYFGHRLKVADFRHLPVAAAFIAMMPQWDLLDFIADYAKQYSTFSLRMSCEAIGVTTNANGRIDGVTLANGEHLPARLVVAADGRRSVLRNAAKLPLVDLGAPMDVLWFRVAKPEGYANTASVPLGTILDGKMAVAIDRGDYWQTARIIAKGAFKSLQAKGLDIFRAEMVSLIPQMADGVAAINNWDEIKLLSVSLDRLTQWHIPGLIAIGDAAHAMSPVGGVGINLAVQDAIALANVLAEPMSQAADPDPLLAKVQSRRWRATVRMQAIQANAHRRVMLPLLSGRLSSRVPLAIRLLSLIPLLRRFPGRILGLGFDRQHLESPIAKEFS